MRKRGIIKMKSLRKTKIVGTIGPASENRVEELFDAGLNVCRVNYSHGSWDEQKEKTEAILKIREEKDLPIATPSGKLLLSAPSVSSLPFIEKSRSVRFTVLPSKNVILTDGLKSVRRCIVLRNSTLAFIIADSLLQD